MSQVSSKHGLSSFKIETLYKCAQAPTTQSPGCQVLWPALLQSSDTKCTKGLQERACLQGSHLQELFGKERSFQVFTFVV